MVAGRRDVAIDLLANVVDLHFVVTLRRISGEGRKRVSLREEADDAIGSRLRGDVVNPGER